MHRNRLFSLRSRADRQPAWLLPLLAAAKRKRLEPGTSHRDNCCCCVASLGLTSSHWVTALTQAELTAPSRTGSSRASRNLILSLVLAGGGICHLPADTPPEISTGDVIATRLRRRGSPTAGVSNGGVSTTAQFSVPSLHLCSVTAEAGETAGQVVSCLPRVWLRYCLGMELHVNFIL